MFGRNCLYRLKMIKARGAFPIRTIISAPLIPYVKTNVKVCLPYQLFYINLPFLVKMYICVVNFKRQCTFLLRKEGLNKKYKANVP